MLDDSLWNDSSKFYRSCRIFNIVNELEKIMIIHFKNIFNKSLLPYLFTYKLSDTLFNE